MMFKKSAHKLFLVLFVFVSTFYCANSLNSKIKDSNNFAETEYKNPDKHSSSPQLFADPNFDSNDEKEDEEHEGTDYVPVVFVSKETCQKFELYLDDLSTYVFFSELLGPHLIPSYILFCSLKICQ